jgi:uncharacterized membrane protein YidH (DUF202 family)
VSASTGSIEDGEWRPGSPAGRTALAWVRTSISIFVSAGATARLAALDNLLLAETMAALAAVAGLASIVLWWRRFRRTTRSPSLTSERIIASEGAVVSAVVAVCAVGVAVASLALRALVS